MFCLLQFRNKLRILRIIMSFELWFCYCPIFSAYFTKIFIDPELVLWQFLLWCILSSKRICESQADCLNCCDCLFSFYLASNHPTKKVQISKIETILALKHTSPLANFYFRKMIRRELLLSEMKIKFVKIHTEHFLSPSIYPVSENVLMCNRLPSQYINRYQFEFPCFLWALEVRKCGLWRLNEAYNICVRNRTTNNSLQVRWTFNFA